MRQEKTVILITSGQPSLNPRLVKEADKLAEAGYNVIVLYQYWNKWGTYMDTALLASRSWKAIRIGGSPDQQKWIYFFSRITHKINRAVGNLLNYRLGFAEKSIGRCTSLLTQAAMQHKGDLYIAHNLAALPAAVNAAQIHNAKCGFDAEDFHRHETSDSVKNPDVILKTRIEEKYFTQINYLTAASPQIAGLYKNLFPFLDPITILNVFDGVNLVEKPRETGLKLVWFSQTIGLNRGLEDIIRVLTNFPNVELHLLGACAASEKSYLQMLAKQYELLPASIKFYDPIAPDELIQFCSKFDIGLALEPGFSINNENALSNKLFTYLQSGLAIVSSDTIAQSEFLKTYPGIGLVYKRLDLKTLQKILLQYQDKNGILKEHQQNAQRYAENQLNWKTEGKQFLTVIHQTLQKE